jgi:hypothetical protein
MKSFKYLLSLLLIQVVYSCQVAVHEKDEGSATPTLFKCVSETPVPEFLFSFSESDYEKVMETESPEMEAAGNFFPFGCSFLNCCNEMQMTDLGFHVNTSQGDSSGRVIMYDVTLANFYAFQSPGADKKPGFMLAKDEPYPNDTVRRSLTKVFIINGAARDEKLFAGYGRAKQIRILVNDKALGIIELNDHRKLQQFDLSGINYTYLDKITFEILSR